MLGPSVYISLDEPISLDQMRIADELAARHPGAPIATPDLDGSGGNSAMVLSFGGLLAAVMQFDFQFSDGWQMAASRAAIHWPDAEATFRCHRAHYSVSLIDDAKTGFLKTDVQPNVKNGALPHISTAATDIIQLGTRSGVFRDERVLVGGSRCVVSHSGRLFHIGTRKRRVVTSEPPARAFDCAAVQSGGQSTLRACAECQNCESHFHLIFLWERRYPPHIRDQTKLRPQSGLCKNKPRGGECSNAPVGQFVAPFALAQVLCEMTCSPLMARSMASISA
jgi:hypothetical protein